MSPSRFSVASASTTDEKGKEKTPFPFQRIAHGGTCGKTRVAPQNRRLRPGPAETDRGSVALVSADIAIRSHEPQIGADDVNPLTTSAFDLPEHLAAKADPALIAGDEQHFAAIAESLEQSINELTERLDAERRAPGGIGQEALDRDLEIHRLGAPPRPPARRRPARPAPLRSGPVPGAHGRCGGRGAGVRRAARPHRQRGSPAAGRLAFSRGRAVLWGDPCQTH